MKEVIGYLVRALWILNDQIKKRFNPNMPIGVAKQCVLGGRIASVWESRLFRINRCLMKLFYSIGCYRTIIFVFSIGCNVFDTVISAKVSH